LGLGRRTGREQAEKVASTAVCEKFIAEVLRPRFLREVRPTAFNYPVAIVGKWHGNKYRFITRYRFDDSRSYEPEFEAPFARLEYVSRDCFDPPHRRVVLSIPAPVAGRSPGVDRKRAAFRGVLNLTTASATPRSTGLGSKGLGDQSS
jgi:hypothetical protein